GRVKIYNLGFVIYTVASLLLTIDWMTGTSGAAYLIGFRIVQGIGGACLLANAAAIITDAFPANQRGLALGINNIVGVSGMFVGLVLGGLLAPIDWRLVFLISVPIGLFGTVWAYLKLEERSVPRRAPIDWWGNVTFALGLVLVMVAVTYGIRPANGHPTGWTSPKVLALMAGATVSLIAFAMIERRVAHPMFRLQLFRIRAFTFGTLSTFLSAVARGGLMFMLIIWLQGIWLPQHGYSFEQTPLWAGIYMLPLTLGFLVSAPASGYLSDRFGARWFSAGGMVLTAMSFVLLEALPIDFDYWAFAAVLLVSGIGMGLFTSPNRAEIMNSLPANSRGAGAGMNATFQNAAMVLSIGVFFSLMIAGLSQNLPSVLEQGLAAHGVPAADAGRVAGLPPVGVLFAAFLGYNPIQQLLGPILSGLPADQATFLIGRSFFPQLISGPFADGLTAAFWFATVACVVAAVASWFASGRTRGSRHESVGGELAASSGELVVDETPREPVAGQLMGAVRTVSGSTVLDSVVTVTDAQGTQRGRSVAAPTGHYTVGGLDSGEYTVVASSPGFRPTVATVTRGGRGVTHDFALDGHGGVRGLVHNGGGDGTAPIPDAVVI